MEGLKTCYVELSISVMRDGRPQVLLRGAKHLCDERLEGRRVAFEESVAGLGHVAHLTHQLLDGHEILVRVQVGVLGLQVVLEHDDVLVASLVHQLAVDDLGVARVEEDHTVDQGVDGEVVLHQGLD